MDLPGALDDLMSAGVSAVFVDELPPISLVALPVDPDQAELLPPGSPLRLSAALHIVATECRRGPRGLPRWIPLSDLAGGEA